MGCFYGILPLRAAGDVFPVGPRAWIGFLYSASIHELFEGPGRGLDEHVDPPWTVGKSAIPMPDPDAF
ncbi:hypothetical protein D3C85_1335020 [compost metagenome]